MGAVGYDIQRAERKKGPWKRIARNVSDAAVQYKPLFSDRTAKIGKTYYYRVRARNSAGVSKVSNTVGPVQVKHLTLIDEFENDSTIFYRSKNLSIRRNQARTCKEDNHRLDGNKGEWVMYRVEGTIQACTLYAFTAGDDSGLIFSVSKDGRHFEKVAVKERDFSSGEGEYGYLRPIRYRTTAIPGAAQYLKIEFGGQASLSRIEIQYGS